MRTLSINKSHTRKQLKVDSTVCSAPSSRTREQVSCTRLLASTRSLHAHTHAALIRCTCTHTNTYQKNERVHTHINGMNEFTHNTTHTHACARVQGSTRWACRGLSFHAAPQASSAWVGGSGPSAGARGRCSTWRAGSPSSPSSCAPTRR